MDHVMSSRVILHFTQNSNFSGIEVPFQSVSVIFQGVSISTADRIRSLAALKSRTKTKQKNKNAILKTSWDSLIVEIITGRSVHLFYEKQDSKGSKWNSFKLNIARNVVSLNVKHAGKESHLPTHHPPLLFSVSTSPTARVGVHLKEMKSHCFNCSLIFHLCTTYQSSVLLFIPSPLSPITLTASSPPFISATVDLYEGGCRSEPEKAPLPKPPCGNQSCHFSNYLKQSFPSPALHYLAERLSLSPTTPHHYFLHYFSVLALSIIP